MRNTAIAVLVFLAILIAAFSPFLFGHKALAPLDIAGHFYQPWARADQPVHNHFVLDAVRQYLGYSYFARVSIRQDGHTGWNPLTFAGKPEYANTMGTYSDWTLQLHRVAGFWDAWHLGLMLQFAIAGLGMFAFLRSLGFPAALSLAAAIAYAGNSQFIVWIYHRWALGSFCWFPWILWSLEIVRRTPILGFAGLAVFTSMALLGGSLQYAALIVIGIACVIASWPVKRAATALLASAAGLLLALPALWPQVQGFLDNAAAGHHRGSLGYEAGWLEPILYPAIPLLSAFPTSLGSVRTLDLAKAFHQDYFSIVHFGFVPVILALVCIFHRDTPRPARFLMIAGLLIPMTPLVGLLYPRAAILFVAGGVWAFVDFWQRNNSELPRRLLIGFAAISLAWGAASAVIAFKRPQIAHAVQTRIDRAGDSRFSDPGLMRQRAASWVDELPIWSVRQFIPWLLAAVSLLALRFRRRYPTTAVSLLIAMLTLETGLFARDWITISDRPPGTVLASTLDIETLTQLVGHDRVYLAAPKNHPLFPPNTLGFFGIATLEGYESIWPESMWHQHDYATTAKALNEQAIRFAIAPRDNGTEHSCWNPQPPIAACWPLVMRAASFEVFRNDYALPRYSVPVQAETYNRRSLLVPPNTSSIHVVENWHPGWHYRIGQSHWQPAIKASDRSMLLPLTPAATNRTLQLEFQPQDHGGPIWAWIALLLFITAAAIRAMRTAVTPATHPRALAQTNRP